MPALIVFFFICLWISKRLGWIVNPFHAYMIPRTIGDHVEPDRPMLWDVYTTQGVKGDGGINWAQMKVSSSSFVVLCRGTHLLNCQNTAFCRCCRLRAGRNVGRGDNRYAL